jgi:hypothetical protein
VSPIRGNKKDILVLLLLIKTLELTGISKQQDVVNIEINRLSWMLNQTT